MGERVTLLVKDKVNITCGELPEKELNVGKERKIEQLPSNRPCVMWALYPHLEVLENREVWLWLPSLT